MDLLNSIKASQLQARKDGNKTIVVALTYVLGEVGRLQDKNTSDKAVRAVVTKTKKNLVAAQTVNATSELAIEIQTLSEFLPEAMNILELEQLIYALFMDDDNVNSIGGLMKALKEYTDGRYTYDGKEAAAIIKRLLIK
ncbi:MAG: GatB/YqeY domain-containing protein [Epibacterium sp.]|nr:GatB/YqeY domain-containing protein [Epibacterium sp.]NQX74743.1 GatB/YqeY domain-containing protein [Epibacterium sp.]